MTEPTNNKSGSEVGSDSDSPLIQGDVWFSPYLFLFWSVMVFLGWCQEYVPTQLLDGSLYRLFNAAIGMATGQLLLLCFSMAYSAQRLRYRWTRLPWVLAGAVVGWLLASGIQRESFDYWCYVATNGVATKWLINDYSGPQENPLLIGVSFFGFFLLFSSFLNSLLCRVRLWNPVSQSYFDQHSEEISRHYHIGMKGMLVGLFLLSIVFLIMTTPGSVFHERRLGDFGLLGFLVALVYAFQFWLAATARTPGLQGLLLLPLPLLLYPVYWQNHELFGRSTQGEHLWFASGFVVAHVIFVVMLLTTGCLPRVFRQENKAWEKTGTTPVKSAKARVAISGTVRRRWKWPIPAALLLLMAVAQWMPLVVDVPAYFVEDRGLSLSLLVAKARRYNGGSFVTTPVFPSNEPYEQPTLIYLERGNGVTEPILIVSQTLRDSPGGQQFDRLRSESDLAFERRYGVDRAELVHDGNRCAMIDGKRMNPEHLQKLFHLKSLTLSEATLNEVWLRTLTQKAPEQIRFRRCQFPLLIFGKDSQRHFMLIRIEETKLTEDLVEKMVRKGHWVEQIKVRIDSTDQIDCSVGCLDHCCLSFEQEPRQVEKILEAVWPGQRMQWEIFSSGGESIVRRPVAKGW